MAADSLATCVAMTSTTKALAWWDFKVLVFNAEGFQLTTLSKYWEILENANVFLFSSYKFRTTGVNVISYYFLLYFSGYCNCQWLSSKMWWQLRLWMEDGQDRNSDLHYPPTRSAKIMMTSALHTTTRPLWGNPSVDIGFPSQRASDVELW